MKKKLKPVLFVGGKYNFHRQNRFQQNILLKAMQVTSDPHELKKMAGMRTVAEVYRTLDKLAIRKEYHEALARNGVDLDSIVNGIKKLCDTSFQDSVKLSGYKTLLKSLGLDEYKENEKDTGKTWEEMIRNATQKELDSGTEKDVDDIIEYDVVEPEAPQDEVEIEEKENKAGKNLYED